ncbi:unnamed protein product [Eruca vesicaria subsp. sativa]|uniref:Major facilitator superfamily (MFS) profile domain-containing protein n=1 Tax=Eruca vesicaria subsp. sativa TaxID=29727 RepID=A0ABC8LDU7_ERUVS|nr:unnamed protein product [Eruca vesicaria subsp. sativa]
MGVAKNYPFIMVGGFVAGIKVGYAMMITSVYMAEVAPATPRGFLSSFSKEEFWKRRVKGSFCPTNPCSQTYLNSLSRYPFRSASLRDRCSRPLLSDHLLKGWIEVQE